MQVSKGLLTRISKSRSLSVEGLSIESKRDKKKRAETIKESKSLEEEKISSKLTTFDM